jgi:hypothetical protein
MVEQELPKLTTRVRFPSPAPAASWIRSCLQDSLIGRRRARYLGDPDRAKADRAMQAMMKMRKILIADLDKAFAG